jgi:shikimate dehydrogenase
LKADDPAAAFAALRAVGFYGANVTAPHKQAACLIADRLDPVASALTAVNTLRWEDDGTISGFNTDAGGVIAALDESHAGWRSMTGTAVILGAGGAARGAAWGLAQAGVRRVLIANRTRKAADEMVSLSPRCQAFDWADLGDLFESADLIVHCTSLGMTKAGDDTPAKGWPMERAPAHCVLMDAVYAPLETPFLRQGRERGLVAVDGLGMLIHQGALAFDIWFGVQPDTRLARTRLMQALAELEA